MAASGSKTVNYAALSGAIKGRWPRVKKVFVEAEAVRGEALAAW